VMSCNDIKAYKKESPYIKELSSLSSNYKGDVRLIASSPCKKTLVKRMFSSSVLDACYHSKVCVSEY
jgi:hypothetical protein